MTKTEALQLLTLHIISYARDEMIETITDRVIFEAILDARSADKFSLLSDATSTVKFAEITSFFYAEMAA